jgi:hypothetical protein
MDRPVMAIGLMIRGIYTTALTCFFLEKGMAIASPSTETAERFKKVKGAVFQEPADVEIRDLEGKQGVSIQGSRDACERVADLIRESFLDAVFRGAARLEEPYVKKPECPALPRADEWPCGFGDDQPSNINGFFHRRSSMLPHGVLHGIDVEFPYLTKSALDEERNKIIPTAFSHHRLRIIGSEYVDLIEKKELATHPEKRRSVSENLERRLIWDGYTPGKEIGLSHVKLSGKVLALSEGEIIRADFKKRKLVLKRSKFKGRSKYDGLDIPKQEGDYAITEVSEGEWFYRHTYLRKNGELIGSYYNVNTPVELYPEEIRYVDLEVDVVVWPDGKAQVKDEEILEERFRMGFLSDRLREAALRVTHHLLHGPAEEDFWLRPDGCTGTMIESHRGEEPEKSGGGWKEGR